MAANWKVVVENYQECYHCAMIHPELCAVSPPESGENIEKDGNWVGGWMDLRDTAQTMSLDGRSGGTAIAQLDEHEKRTVMYVAVLPNLLISLHPDYVMSHLLTPISPDRTRIRCSWAFPAEVANAEGFDPAYAVDFWDITNKQDWAACESVQRGMKAPTSSPARSRRSRTASTTFVSYLAKAYRGVGLPGRLNRWQGVSMAYYLSVGDVPPKRHTQHRDPDGQPLPRGADGRGGVLLRLLAALPPRRAVGDRRQPGLGPARPDPHAQPPAQAAAPQAAHAVPRGRDRRRGHRPAAGARQQRRADQRTSSPAPTPSPYYRNAIGDECVYVESGSGTVETVFGRADLPGRRLRADPAGHHAPLGARRAEPALPDRGEQPHRARRSATSRATGSCSSTRRTASATCTARRTRRSVVEGDGRRGAGQAPARRPAIVGTRMTYATHPFDVVGWDGCLYPYTFNVEDYMPITGKVHQPPPVHQVFEGHNFVVCNFLPRKVDYHPLSIPVPYYHSNVDSDEVMFYVGGDYEARKGSGINIGSISLHPGGHAHGPQPSAIEASLGAEYFDESAVMVDTFAPLDLGEGGLAAEDPAYAWTWAGRGRTRAATATADRRSSPTRDGQRHD